MSTTKGWQRGVIIMGLTGRKPIPASLISPAEHKKSADDIAARQEAEKRLQTKATLNCPSHISVEAKKEWRRIMKLYRSMDAEILCDLDLQPLVMYCEATAIYKKAQETWTKYTAVVSSNPEAQRVLDKCFSIMERQTRLICSLSEQLCLTPVGRARMGTNATSKKEPSSLESLFNEDD